MKFFVQAVCPNQPFGAYVKDGTAGQKIQDVLAAVKPEIVYFAEIGGKRVTLMIVEISDVSQLPSIAEPFFLTFDASVEFHPVMSGEDFARSGLDQIVKKLK
jgi:hypothetical protein